MRRRISVRVVGRPATDLPRQKRWNARRCQATTVSGLTRTRESFQLQRRRKAQTGRRRGFASTARRSEELAFAVDAAVVAPSQVVHRPNEAAPQTAALSGV